MKIIELSIPQEEIELGPHAIIQRISESYPVHTHIGFYEIFLVVEGQAIHYINNSSQLISERSLVFVRPSDVHYYVALNRYDAQFIDVGFPQSELARALNFYELPINLITDPGLPVHLHLEEAGFDGILSKLIHLSQLYPSKNCLPLFRSVLADVCYPLTKISRQELESRDSILPDWLSSLDQELIKPEIFLRGTEAIYENCSYSQEHVIRQFQKYFHMTPTEYINSKKMEYACSLLLTRKYKTIDVCYRSGFNNLSHFYDTFRKTYGCTPRQFIAKTAEMETSGIEKIHSAMGTSENLL